MKNLFMIGIMLISFGMHAQKILSGKISDQNGNPLYGVTIGIPDLNKGTRSSDDGSYHISQLPAGKMYVYFSLPGYAEHNEMVELNTDSTVLNIVMEVTVIETEEVVISAGYRSTQHQNAVKIDKIDVLSIDLKSTPNFMEMITKVPGVDMISKGSGISKPVIRGLSMNDVLVLNNGVRHENYQYSDHHPLGIDEFGIEDVEIIKGPASLLYGSDAIGGIINFIRERPAPIGSYNGDYHLQMFSNTMGISQNLGFNVSGKRLFGGLRGGFKSNADYLQGGGQFVPNTRFNEYSVKSYVGFTGKIGVFKLFYDQDKRKLGLPKQIMFVNGTERGRWNEMFYQQLNNSLISSQNRIYLGNFKLDINAGYQMAGLIHFEDPGVYEIQMQLNTLTYEAKLSLPSDKKSEYIFGIQGFHQTNRNLNDREVILLPDARADNYSGFGLLQFTFFNTLKVQTGLRYDYKTIVTDAVGLPMETTYRSGLNKDFGSFSGSFGATWRVNESLLFRANGSAAYRTPNLAELTSNGPHELRYEVGDKNLVPENSYEADLSMHYHISGLMFDLAGFYNRVDHYIFIAATGDTALTNIPIYMYEQADAYLYGGEAGLHLHPSFAKRLHLEGGFSYVIGEKRNGEYLPFIPAHKLRLEFRFQEERLWQFREAFVSLTNLNAFDQNKPAPEETATEAYTLFDISAGGKFFIVKQPVEFRLSMNNLFDTQYIDHLSTLKKRNSYDPGRNITLSLRIPFRNQ